LQILARSPLAVRALGDGYKAHFRTGSLEPRRQELLRLRSSQLNACQPCSASRKEGTVSEQDVACLDDPEQVVELGWLCAQSLGVHRLMHTLDVLGTEPAVLH
jgi:alkylhydroperoxidase family enzyme